MLIESLLRFPLLHVGEGIGVIHILVHMTTYTARLYFRWTDDTAKGFQHITPVFGIYVKAERGCDHRPSIFRTAFLNGWVW